MAEKMTSLSEQDSVLMLSESALSHIRKSIQKSTTSPEPVGMRIHVKKAGCSGYEYVLGYAYPKELQDSDCHFMFEDISIFIDQAIYQKFFKGKVHVDFQKEMTKEGFIFDNPNVANQCGCGESFTLVDEE